MLSLRILIFIFCFSLTFCFGQDRKIEFPDISGYKTLKCDLHIHTVFSDGLVWPSIRVDEAVKDGLDAISLTEHIEYQPWKKDIPNPDRNRSYVLAKEYAKPHDLLIIHGTEITRRLPPGHANALFVKDVNKINVPDSIESYREAVRQGAFVFWNHPDWIGQKKNGIAEITDLHKFLISQKLLHGVEVVNDLTFSEEALKIANDYNLTVMGTSDIHGLVDYEFNIGMGGHRPVTLVFAKARNEESIKEALFAGRTVTWFNHILAGKEEHLKPLLNTIIEVKNKDYIGSSSVLELELVNNSSAKIILKNKSKFTIQRNGLIVELLPKSITKLEIRMSSADKTKEALLFEVVNAMTNQKKTLDYSVDLSKF
jgi:3',5'-nucleoside bisphosphate phosphatase